MIIGHQKQWQFLKKSFELGKISHAYLFTGQEKLGKKTMALEWASLIIEQSEMKKRIKFSSPDESRIAKMGSKKQASSLALADVRAKEDLSSLTLKGHPDLILIEPEESDSLPLKNGAVTDKKALTGKEEIKIDQIRKLIWKLSLKPYSAPLKVAIIDRAHLMNEDAQNCFLKTLEEPKDKTLIILITEYPETLFSTILSRCEQIKFYPVKKEEIINYLKTRASAKREDENKVFIAYRAKRGLEMNERSSTTRASAKREDERSSSTDQNLSEEDIQKIIKISLGRPGVVIDFIEFPQRLKEREEKIKELIKISDSDIALRFQYAKGLAQDGNLRELLNIWLSYFRNVLLKKCLTPDIKYSHYSISKLKTILKLLQNTNFLISTTNVNNRLALEILMLEL